MQGHNHQYETKDRTISFTGYCMKGLSDLTSVGTVTGEALWPSSLLLADYLKDEWNPTPNTNVLELGCGLGLCGTVASIRLGEKNGGKVVVTDGSSRVMDRACKISQANIKKEIDAPLSLAVLEWGNQVQMDHIRHPDGYDCIIGSDIFYYPSVDVSSKKNIALFVQTVDSLLKKTTTSSQQQQTPQCIITVERRNVSLDVLFEAFDKNGFVQSKIGPKNEDVSFFEDIYGERNDEQTMFTNKFLLIFERKSK